MCFLVSLRSAAGCCLVCDEEENQTELFVLFHSSIQSDIQLMWDQNQNLTSCSVIRGCCSASFYSRCSPASIPSEQNHKEESSCEVLQMAVMVPSGGSTGPLNGSSWLWCGFSNLQGDSVVLFGGSSSPFNRSGGYLNGSDGLLFLWDSSSVLRGFSNLGKNHWSFKWF